VRRSILERRSGFRRITSLATERHRPLSCAMICLIVSYPSRSGDLGMEPVSATSAWIKVLIAIRDFPLWVLVAAALSLTIFVYVPNFNELVSPATNNAISFAAIVAWIFAGARGSVSLIEIVRSHRDSREANRRFYVTSVDSQCHWSVSRQSDGSLVTQISAHLMVKNRAAEPLHVMSVRVFKPTIRGETLPGLVVTRGQQGREYGTPYVSGNFIRPGETLPVAATILIRGVPRQREGTMHATLDVLDADGHRERVKVELRRIPGPDHRT
jgi:hypothetical protein